MDIWTLNFQVIENNTTQLMYRTAALCVEDYERYVGAQPDDELEFKDSFGTVLRIVRKNLIGVVLQQMSKYHEALREVKLGTLRSNLKLDRAMKSDPMLNGQFDPEDNVHHLGGPRGY